MLKKTQKFVFRSALRPNQFSFSHGLNPLQTSIVRGNDRKVEIFECATGRQVVPPWHDRHALAGRSPDSTFSVIYYRFPGRRERQIDFEPNALASKAFRLQQSVKSIAYASAAYF